MGPPAVVYFFPAGVLFSTENAIKTAFSKVYSGNTNINMPNKKHERKAKHQIRQKNTKYAKRNTKCAKKYTKYANKTPTTPKKNQICKKTKYSKILQFSFT